VTRNMVVHLSGAIKVFTNHMIDMNINSLGKEIGDSRIEMVLSRVEIFFSHISRDLSHCIMADLIDNMASSETVFGIIGKEVHRFKHVVRMSQIVKVNNFAIIGIIDQTIVVFFIMGLSIRIRVKVSVLHFRIGANNIQRIAPSQDMLNLVSSFQEALDLLIGLIELILELFNGLEANSRIEFYALAWFFRRGNLDLI